MKHRCRHQRVLEGEDFKKCLDCGLEVETVTVEQVDLDNSRIIVLEEGRFVNPTGSYGWR